jgi:hypothetical protein
MRQRFHAAAAVMGALVLAAPSKSDIISGNFSGAVSSTGTIFGINTTSIFKAVGWTMGGEDYLLESAVLTMEFLGGTAVVSIWSGTASGPTQQIAVLNSPPQVGSGDFTFTPGAPLIMEAGQTYWLYLASAPNPTAQFRWNGTSPSTVPTGIATSVGFNFNGTASATRNRFEVRGSPAAPVCYANCDGSTTAPILNVEDFTCFINEFAAASQLPHEQQLTHYANCDESTTAPVLNVEDFTCFINKFAQGCS